MHEQAKAPELDPAHGAGRPLPPEVKHHTQRGRFKDDTQTHGGASTAQPQLVGPAYERSQEGHDRTAKEPACAPRTRSSRLCRAVASCRGSVWPVTRSNRGLWDHPRNLRSN